MTPFIHTRSEKLVVIHTASLSEAVEAVIRRSGERIVCGAPLGLGKPVPLLNALYARVASDSALSLSIVTALSLEVPRGTSGLERRFLEPITRRIFAGVPELDYVRDQRAGKVPPNVSLTEFYFRPGALLGTPIAQQNYISSNYTHAARDIVARGANALVVMVAERGGRYSLSCNPDLTVDVAQAMRRRGAPSTVAAMVNRNLPFMTGDALVPGDFFDVVLDAPEHEHALFGVPNPPIEPVEHVIGLRASALVKDGGTLQLGIGSLGDAVAHWLRQRHVAPASYAEACEAIFDGGARAGVVALDGGTGPFGEGLFASSEMFTWGMMVLMRAGVIRRRADGATGPVLQGGFFLGPREFYDTLRGLSDSEREDILMTSVARINDMFGEEGAVRRQRRDARFINTCMMATISGAAVSDGLADGRVVSGVGGQYNFIAMAHELEGARSILLLRSTREAGGRTESNIVFNYGHITIPRHLRDIFVTEYGVADLRSRTDAEVAAALIGIADARFQEDLTARAKAAGKLPPGWHIPDAARRNTPEDLSRCMRPLAAKSLLPEFPLGTDFDAEEIRLIHALRWLKAHSTGWRRLELAAALGAAPDERERATLERLGLARPRGLREAMLCRLVTLGLRRDALRIDG